MSQKIQFTKMHGVGNDYIYIDTSKFPIENPEELAIKWSVPHKGIGADGIILIGKSEIADFSMRIFNADGSEALMCGNGSRCVGKYVYDKGLTTSPTVTLETQSGIKILQLHITDGLVSDVTVDMGAPVVGETLTLEAEGQSFTGLNVSMGNPHFVIFVDDLSKIELSKVGPVLENNPVFPNRTNVEFVQVLSPDKVRMRVWERGSGITQACGTGACATVVAGITSGKTEKQTTVVMDGGPVVIAWDGAGKNVFMTGEAVTVFEGTIEK